MPAPAPQPDPSYNPQEASYSGPGPYINGDPRLLTPEYQAWLKYHANPNAGSPPVSGHATIDDSNPGSKEATDPLRGGFDLDTNAETEAWQKFYEGQDPGKFGNVSFDTAAADRARTQQQALIQQYHTLAAGDKNSIAQQQLRKSIDAAKSQALSSAANVKGVSAGAALRAGQNQQQQLGLQGRSDSQMLMLQEQEQARQALLNMYAQQRGSDINVANTSADVYGKNQGLQDAYSLFNATQLYNEGDAQRRSAIDRIRAQQGLDKEVRNNTQADFSRGAQAVGTAASTFARLAQSTESTGAKPQGRAAIDAAFDGD